MSEIIPVIYDNQVFNFGDTEVHNSICYIPEIGMFQIREFHNSLFRLVPPEDKYDYMQPITEYMKTLKYPFDTVFSDSKVAQEELTKYINSIATPEQIITANTLVKEFK